MAKNDSAKAKQDKQRNVMTRHPEKVTGKEALAPGAGLSGHSTLGVGMARPGEHMPSAPPPPSGARISGSGKPTAAPPPPPAAAAQTPRPGEHMPSPPPPPSGTARRVSALPSAGIAMEAPAGPPRIMRPDAGITGQVVERIAPAAEKRVGFDYPTVLRGSTTH